MFNNFDYSKWMKELFNPKEQDQFQKIMSQFSPQTWDVYSKQWQEMFKKVETHLSLDPKSLEAKVLYDEWMNLLDKLYHGFPDLKQKAWDAYKNSVKTDLEYFNHKVIEFIDQVGKLYQSK